MLSLRRYFPQLHKVPLFYEVKPEDYPSMLGCIGAFVRLYDKGETIDLLESNQKLVGVVLSGQVHMIQEDLWGHKAILLDIGPDEMFGETFACGGEIADNVSFVALEKTEVMLLPFARIMHTCASSCGHHQRVIMNMVIQIARKNAKLMTKVDVISKGTLREKISAYLTKQAQLQHPDILDRMQFPIGVQLSLSRQELAEYLHADRSALSRELGRMKTDGLIDYDKKTVSILKELY